MERRRRRGEGVSINSIFFSLWFTFLGKLSCVSHVWQMPTSSFIQLQICESSHGSEKQSVKTFKHPPKTSLSFDLNMKTLKRDYQAEWYLRIHIDLFQ